MPEAAGQKPKRFYKSVGAEARASGHAVTLDGRILQTPGGRELLLPTAALAAAIADEWEAQEEEIDRAVMPMTGLASAAIDHDDRERIISDIMGYGETDLLCYRVAQPEALAQQQDALWQPMLDWLTDAHGASLAVTRDIRHVAQDAAALDRLRGAVKTLDAFALAGLRVLVLGTGSIVLGLAALGGRLDAGETATLSQLDETFQAKTWGEDPEAAARREEIGREFEEAARFLELLAAGPTSAWKPG